MQTIYLDISSKGVYPCIYAKQGEVGRKFLAVITDGGVPYSVPEDALLSVWYEGKSGSGNYTDIGEESAISVDGNKITVELISQMLSVSGDGVLTVVINSADGKQIGLWNIDYCVEFVAGSDSQEAQEYYTAFSAATKDLAEASKKFFVDKTLSISGSPADAAETGRQISVERRRINNVIAMKDQSGNSIFEIGDEFAYCTIKSNGATAVVECTIEYLTIAEYGRHRTPSFEIPASVAPIREYVYFEHTTENIKISLEVESVENEIANVFILVENTGSSEKEITRIFSVSEYVQSGLFIPELADVRVGYDGNNYPTAGDAVRNQINSIWERIEKNAIINTAIGKGLTLEDSIKAPVRNLKAWVMASQEGEGTPSAENVRPIVPYEGSTVTISVGSTADMPNPTLYSSGTLPTNMYGGYVDWLRGVFVQTHESVTIDGNKGYITMPTAGNFYMSNYVLPKESQISTGDLQSTGMCDSIPYGKGNGTRNIFCSGANVWFNGINECTTPAELKAYLQEKPVHIVYPLQTPIEHPLADMPNTEILLTDAPCYVGTDGSKLEIDYVCETQSYIDKKFAELQNAILATGANV